MSQNHTIKITLVKDNNPTCDFISNALANIGYEVTGVCNSYDSFLNSYENSRPDIVLLDIKTGGAGTGIDIGSYLRRHDHTPFIFLSSVNDKKAIDEVKKIMPAAYLIKPFNEDDLYAAIEIAVFNHAKKPALKEQPAGPPVVLPDFIFIRQKQAYIKIAWKDILYLEATGNYLKIVVLNDVYTVRQSMHSLVGTFPSCFFKVHRSFLVNLHFALKIEHNTVLLTNNTVIPISRDIYSTLIESIRVLND